MLKANALLLIPLDNQRRDIGDHKLTGVFSPSPCNLKFKDLCIKGREADKALI